MRLCSLSVAFSLNRFGQVKQQSPAQCLGTAQRVGCEGTTLEGGTSLDVAILGILKGERRDPRVLAVWI